MAANIEWGNYPIGIEHDDGGFFDEAAIAPEAVAEEKARGAYYRRLVEQRGTNNAYLYEREPERLRYAYGAGCMNNACKAKDCHYDQYCEKATDENVMTVMPTAPKFSFRNVLMFVLFAVLAGYLYKKFISKKR